MVLALTGDHSFGYTVPGPILDPLDTVPGWDPLELLVHLDDFIVMVVLEGERFQNFWFRSFPGNKLTVLGRLLKKRVTPTEKILVLSYL